MENILFFLKDNKDALTIIISTIIGFIGLGTFVKAIVEYKLQGRQKRADLYQKFNAIFEQESTKKIVALLEEDSDELLKISPIERYLFLGFYEQVAMAVNSKLINKNVAHYMFGYFAIRCWESEKFWKDINKNSYYWHVFKRFAKQMQKVERSQIYRSKFLKMYDIITSRNNFKY